MKLTITLAGKNKRYRHSISVRTLVSATGNLEHGNLLCRYVKFRFLKFYAFIKVYMFCERFTIFFGFTCFVKAC